MPDSIQVAVIGAGNVGIAVAYYLLMHHGIRRVTLVEAGAPTAMTSAKWGENYRNWWPHPALAELSVESAQAARAVRRSMASARLRRAAVMRRLQGQGWVVPVAAPSAAAELAAISSRVREYASELQELATGGTRKALGPSVTSWRTVPAWPSTSEPSRGGSPGSLRSSSSTAPWATLPPRQ